MNLRPFFLERYFARYEFSVPYQLSPSDCEPLQMQELLDMADAHDRQIWNNLSLGYTESPGHPELRQAILRQYSSIRPEDTLVLAPEEGIFIAMQVLLQPGDHVVTTFPAYQSLYEVAQARGAKVGRWMPRKSHQWIFHTEDLQALVSENTRLLVMNFPHNPTGASLSERTFRWIVEWAADRGIMVFSDEMYRFLEPEGSRTLPAACDIARNAVSLGGVSKSLSAPGLRIGWLASRNGEFLQKAATFKDYTTICSSAPAERLAIVAIKAREILWKKNRDIISKNTKVLHEFFARYQNLFRWMPPQAGPVAFPELLADVSVDAFCRQLVDEKGVMLLPASVYEYAGNHFRISTARRDMPEALEVFDAFLQKHYH